MKALAVLGICLLVALSGASEADKDNQNVPESETKKSCESFKGVVEKTAENFGKEIEINSPSGTKITPELQIQIKVNALSKAVSECVPNKQVYRYVLSVIDALDANMRRFPTPENVLRNIAITQESMDQDLDGLEAAQYEDGYNVSSTIHSRINEFFEESVQKAADIFERNQKQAEAARKVFDDTPILGVLDRLVEKMDHCQGISPTDYKTIYSCHREVRSVAEELNRIVGPLHPMFTLKLFPPEITIDTMYMHFTAGLKVLQWMIENEKNNQKFLREYKGFMP